MTAFATVADAMALWREMTPKEQARAEVLLNVISDSLRYEADKVGLDLDVMIAEKPVLASVAKSVVIDVMGRNLNTSTTAEPMTQVSESALGYSMSGSYLVPGGGIFIKKSELARLGIKRQKIGHIDLC